MNNNAKYVYSSKTDPEFCGQLWPFKIFVKMRCYQNKMYNTVVWLCCGRCAARICPNALHMSGNSTDPSYFNTARVDVLLARPVCNDVAVLLHTSIAAVKMPVKPNKMDLLLQRV